MSATTSTYVFECVCGKKVTSTTPTPALQCPNCGRPWVFDWAHEIEKAKGAS